MSGPEVIAGGLMERGPLHNIEHMKKCTDAPCIICQETCFEGVYGHYFPCIDGDCPCSCGLYKSVKDLDRARPHLEEEKMIDFFKPEDFDPLNGTVMEFASENAAKRANEILKERGIVVYGNDPHSGYCIEKFKDDGTALLIMLQPKEKK